MLFFVGKNWRNTLNKDLIPDINNSKITKIFNFSEITINSLMEILKIYKNVYIIPMMETDMILLDKYNIPYIGPDINNVKTFMCKKQFSIYAQNNSLEDYIPKTYNKLEDIDESEILILKPFNLCYGRGMKIINKEDILKDYFDDYIIQEYIRDNSEYVIHILAKDGKIIEYISYQYKILDIDNSEIFIRTKEFSDKHNIDLIKNTLSKDYLDIFEKFLLPCKYSGPCNFDYKLKNGQIKVLEINPRLGGSLMLQKNRKDLCFFINKLLDQ